MSNPTRRKMSCVRYYLFFSFNFPCRIRAVMLHSQCRNECNCVFKCNCSWCDYYLRGAHTLQLFHVHYAWCHGIRHVVDANACRLSTGSAGPAASSSELRLRSNCICICAAIFSLRHFFALHRATHVRLQFFCFAFLFAYAHFHPMLIVRVPSTHSPYLPISNYSNIIII